MRRALLIGIDSYAAPPDSSSKRILNLNGCVNDVNAVEKFLNSRPYECEISKLTSPTVDNAVADPTYDNIVQELKNLSTLCCAGDLVYIHYSGHGCRRFEAEVALPEDGGSHIQGMTLVPMDAIDAKKLITGRLLGSIVQEMTQKPDVHVFVVLDSCFSGGGFRKSSTATGFTPRFDENLIVDDNWMKHADEEAKGIEEHLLTSLRNTTPLPNWFSAPSGCTLITACGTYQTAGEEYCGLNDGQRRMHGLLTHYMLDLLENHRIPAPTCAQIARHLHLQTSRKSVTSTNGVVQTPQTIGDIHMEFFGTNRMIASAFCRVIDKTGGKFLLNAGELQGVFRGAEFNIIQENDALRHQSGVRVEIDKSDTFRSWALVSIPKPEDSALSELEGQGCIAVLRRWALPSPVKVRLTEDDGLFRNSFAKGLERTHNLQLCPIEVGTEKAQFEVTMDQNSIFQLREPGESPITRLPVIKRRDDNDAEKLAYLVCHVARYRAIERHLLQLRQTKNYRKMNLKTTLHCPKNSREVMDIDNFPDEFRECSDHDPNKYCKLQRNGYLWFKLERDERKRSLIRSLEALCVRSRPKTPESVIIDTEEETFCAIFELNSTWGIGKKYPLENDSLGIGSCRKLMLTAGILGRYREQDTNECVDKCFVLVAKAKAPPSFDLLTLPSLPFNSDRLPLPDHGDAIFENTRNGGDRTEFDEASTAVGPNSLPKKLWIDYFEIRISPATDPSSSNNTN